MHEYTYSRTFEAVLHDYRIKASSTIQDAIHHDAAVLSTNLSKMNKVAYSRSVPPLAHTISPYGSIY
jgi:hypothetical protein